MEIRQNPLPRTDEYHLRETLEAAQVELVNLLKQKEEMEWRIHKLQTDIVHLAALCHVEVEDPIRQLGLTDAVRWVFANKGKPLTAKQVVEELGKSWTEAGSYKNITANVSTVIRRLKKADEIKLTVPDEPGNALGWAGYDDGDKYVWSGGLPPLPLHLQKILRQEKGKISDMAGDEKAKEGLPSPPRSTK